MTKTLGEQRCRWCGGRFVQQPGRGRPRRYCRGACRQQAHLARKLADSHRLGADEVVVKRSDLEAIQGALYGLQAALEDVEVDVADDDSTNGLRAALDHLRREARPVADLWITPVTAEAESD